MTKQTGLEASGMNRFLLLFLAAAFAMPGCKSSSGKEKELIRNGVAEFCDKYPSGRSSSAIASHVFQTSKGNLEISTCGAKKRSEGDWYSEGPARSDGYFIIPRGVWVSDADEAVRMLLDDFAKGNCIPVAPEPVDPASP